MKNWIKKNVLAEIPIIGGMFEEKGYGHALHHGAKMTCHLTGSAIAMILYMENNPMPEGDTTAHHATSPTQYYAKMVVYMALGEMIGAVTFNSLSKLAKSAQNIYVIWNGRREEKKLIIQKYRSDESNINLSS